MSEEATTLKPGDQVSWNSVSGKIDGTVVKKVTSETHIKSHHVNASKDDPQYIVKSDKTGALAAHKPEALHSRSNQGQGKQSSGNNQQKQAQRSGNQSGSDNQRSGNQQQGQQQGSSGEHVKQDGTPDLRYKENKEEGQEDSTSRNSRADEEEEEDTNSSEGSEHLKQDGTPDMRFKENKGEEDDVMDDEEEEEGGQKKRKATRVAQSSADAKKARTESDQGASKKQGRQQQRADEGADEGDDDHDDHSHSGDRDQIIKDFQSLVNMSASDIEEWLESKDSQDVGFMREGESESVGHQSGRKIIEMLRKKPESWSDEEVAHARKVRGYIKRHSAQRPHNDDLGHTRWTYSLKNWGHDPLKQ